MWWSFAFPIRIVGLGISVGAIAPINPIFVSPTFAQTSSLCPAQLAAEISQIASHPKLSAARVGVIVEPISKIGSPLVNLDGDRYFIPASNLKLFTTAAALINLGAEYRIPTRIMAGQLSAQGVLASDLVIEGNGDPSLTSESLKQLVKQLRDRGIRQIQGNLILRDRLHPTASTKLGEGWEWQDLQEDFGAMPHAFSVNQNVLNWTISPAKTIGQSVFFSWDEPNSDPDLVKNWQIDNQAITTGKLNSLIVTRALGQERITISGEFPLGSATELGATAVLDPGKQFERLFLAELSRQGIRFNPVIQSINKDQSTIIYAQIRSPRLADLIQTTNKQSNNLYAELIFQNLLNHSKKPEISQLNSFWQSLGIQSDRLQIVDGSGLSRHNLVTPRAVIQLLQAMAKNRNFRDSLAIAAIDGTLKNRFQNTAAAQKLQAKTGTLKAVSTLSGYLKPDYFPELVFSIMINNSMLTTAENQAFVDAIALKLSRLKSCD